MGSRGQNSEATASLHRPLLFWSLPFAFLGFGLPIFSKELGASALEIGGLFSVFTAMTIVLRPVIGWAVDRFGRRYFFVIALLVYSLAMMAFSVAGSLSGLYLARMLQGIGASFLFISVNTMVADLTGDRERGRAFGRIDEITARGSLIGIFAGFFIISSLPDGVAWQIVFTGYAIMAAVGAVLAWRNVPETKPDGGEAAPQKMTLSRSVVILLLVVFIMSASEAMLGPIYLIFLQDKFTTNISRLAWAFLPAGLVTAFLSSRLGALSDRFSRIKMMALGLAGAGLISLALPEAPTILFLALLYTCSAVLWAIARPAVTAIFADLAGVEQRGRSYGLFTLVGNLGVLCGPIIGGSLYDTFAHSIPFYLNGYVLILCAVCARIFLRNLSLRTSPHKKETVYA
jgi:DHA1 family multidrug resistance protein-like MFS transporter